MHGAKYKLYYWPLPFRGCFISYLFAFRDTPLLQESGFDENNALRALDPKEQPTPYMGPPLLVELETGRAISQMPAIALYVSRELDLMPADDFEAAMAMKVLMDCNDLLMEICRYNGSMMWQREEWIAFRSKRLPRWMAIFEASLHRKTIGNGLTNFADIAVFALFGNMIRCLPELEKDLLNHAPGIHAHCNKIGATSSLEHFMLQEESSYGTLYCGGQIEQSIRQMLAMDNDINNI